MNNLFEPKFLPGNQITLLRGGQAYFPALVAAIEAATQTIYLQTYIFELDNAGITVGSALKQAALRGVSVNVLLDGFGAKDMPNSYKKELENAGVQLMFYRPKISPWTLKKNRLRRMHRKIAVIDNKQAFVGGINIIDDYNVPDNTPPRIDYAVRIEGTLLPRIASSVTKLWNHMAFRRFNGPTFYAASQTLTKTAHAENKLNSAGMRAAFVLRDNVVNRYAIESAYLDAINNAISEIIIANAYFVPGRRFRVALLNAAKRGVQVELLLQGRMEYFLMFATHAFYSLFLKNGIHIFEYRKSFMHCKVAVIDGYWSTVGSSNIDPFSMMLAREANIIVEDSAFAKDLRNEIVNNIRLGACRVDANQWLAGNRIKRGVSWLVYALVRVSLGIIGHSNER